MRRALQAPPRLRRQGSATSYPAWYIPPLQHRADLPARRPATRAARFGVDQRRDATAYATALPTSPQCEQCGVASLQWRGDLEGQIYQPCVDGGACPWRETFRHLVGPLGLMRSDAIGAWYVVVVVSRERGRAPAASDQSSGGVAHSVGYSRSYTPYRAVRLYRTRLYCKSGGKQSSSPVACERVGLRAYTGVGLGSGRAGAAWPWARRRPRAGVGGKAKGT